MADIGYLTMADAVRAVYSTDSDIWRRVAFGGVGEQDWTYLKQVPGVSIVKSASGKFIGYDYTNPFPASTNPGAIVDSNLQTGQYGIGSFEAKIPATVNTDTQTGLITSFESGAKTVSTGSKVMSIAGDVGLAVGATALGIKAGKFIDSLLYSVAPDFWDEVCPTLNPETWGDIITGENPQEQVFRAIFGIDDNDNTTMYMDEKALAYMYAVLLENGAYSSGDGGEITYDSSVSSRLTNPTIFHQPIITTNGYGYTNINPQYPSQYPELYTYSVLSGNPVCLIFYTPSSTSAQIRAYWLSTSPFTLDRYYVYASGATGHTTTSSTSETVPGYGTIYFSVSTDKYPVNSSVRGSYYNGDLGVTNFTEDVPLPQDIYKIFLYGTYTPTPALEGITDNPDAGIHITPSNVINQTTGNPVTPQDNIDDILEALKLAYPGLFADAIYEDILQEDGTVERHTYIPTPLPTEDEDGNPITKETPGVDPQQNPEVNPENTPESELQDLTDGLTESGEQTAPDTGGGSTPPVVPPTGTANALYAIYNPSQGELNSFGAWLWSSNFVDQLLKLFNDPMQAIIGLHKVFVTPSVSGRQNIKVGYLDSGVASNVVSAQYETVNCGSVNISEYFGNVFDYDPFTQIYIYLPFVGIQRLDTGDVMRSTLNVVYNVDVLTGACLVEVNVYRDAGGGTLYTYTGNCAVQYPISSGSYMGIIASLASVVGGVVGTIATGGALAPVALGAVSGVMNAHTRVEHSGGFSGNAGAMGNKKPYVIITRPQTCLADNFPAYDGYPANKTTTINDCSGFVRCEVCHVENVPATDAELSEIENLLKSGIII